MRRVIVPLLLLAVLAVGLYRSGQVPQAFAQAPTATATGLSPADLLPGAMEIIATAIVASSETALVATPTVALTGTATGETTPTPGGETSPTAAGRATATRGADETPEPQTSRTIEPTAPETATAAPLPTAITSLEIPEENNSPSGTTLVLLAGAGLVVVLGGILARRR